MHRSDERDQTGSKKGERKALPRFSSAKQGPWCGGAPRSRPRPTCRVEAVRKPGSGPPGRATLSTGTRGSRDSGLPDRALRRAARADATALLTRRGASASRCRDARAWCTFWSRKRCSYSAVTLHSSSHGVLAVGLLEPRNLPHNPCNPQ